MSDTLWPIDFQVTLDGNDFTEYVIEIEFKTSICNPGSGLEISIAPEIDREIVPYEDVVIYIDGTKVFTGYTQNNIRARQPTSQVIYCEDAIAKVTDTWNTDMFLESRGETIGHWIKYFLNLSQVSSSVSGAGAPAPPKVFGIVQAFSAITELMRLDAIQMTVDADGQVVVKNHAIDEDSAITVDDILSWERETNDFRLRNRSVVFGYGPEQTVDVMSYVPELNDNGEIRTMILASPDIYWPGTAHGLANMALTMFGTPSDILTFDCPGDPDIRAGSTVIVADQWGDWSRTGLVTSLSWRVSEDVGYIMTITLDEKCAGFWVADTRPTILYAATEGAGVWKSFDDTNWSDISGEELENAYARDLAVIKGESIIGTDDTVWVAATHGIFKTETGTSPWTNMTENMDGRAASVEWSGVIVHPGTPEEVYCLGNYASGPTKLYDIGGAYITTLPARTVIYMYITYDNGETWNRYTVNNYTVED